MDHPISSQYLDSRTARVEAVLLAAGAWDAAPIVLDCPVFGSLTFYFKYTRGGAAGGFGYKVEVSPDGSNFYQTALYSPGALAAGSDVESAIQREQIEYVATGDPAERFVFGPIDLAGTVEQVRISACEVGNVAAPGTLEILARFS